jgi:hypothetical protein
LNHKTESSNTISQYDEIFDEARTLFARKNQDYGASWTILRPTSLTDQIYIKAARIRSIEEKESQLVEDDVRDDYIGLINYCVMALIQLRRGRFEELTDTQDVIQRYDDEKSEVRELMLKKNHDYGEAWRSMRISSMTDLILMKLLRIRSIEDNHGQVEVSEDIDAGFKDIINYAIFALILQSEANQKTKI